MRKILFFVLIICSSSVLAQSSNWNKMNQEQQKDSLIKLSKQVIMNFGPGYYRANEIPTIAIDTFSVKNAPDSKPQTIKNFGRQYYQLTFGYDKTKENLAWSFSSKVDIWKDTIEPAGVTFGNGIGVFFDSKSYKEMRNDAKRPIIPYQPAKKGYLY